MVEVIHPTQPIAVPALPILASALLDAEVRKSGMFGGRIKTRCELDDVLDGGFERGCVVGISQSEGHVPMNGYLISLQALGVNLLTNPTSKALIITTVNTQLPLESIVPILQELSGRMYRGESSPKVTSAVEEILTERVQVTRVHDLEELCMVWGGSVGDEGTEVVIVESIVAYMSDRLSNAPDNTKTLLQDLSKLIRSRTREQNLLTIMHNGTTETKLRDASQNSTMSVFSDNTSRPKFGQFFDQFIDMHLLVSQIPEDEGVSTVVEIVKDETPILADGREKRFRSREQLWTSVNL